MGRAIDMENKLETLDRRLKLVEDALRACTDKSTSRRPP